VHGSEQGMGTAVTTATAARPRPRSSSADSEPDTPRQSTSPRRHPEAPRGGRPNTLAIVVVAIAVVAAVAGLSVTVLRALGDSPAIAVGTEARSDDMSLWVSNVEFVAHDHSAHDHSAHDHGDEGEDGHDDSPADVSGAVDTDPGAADDPTTGQATDQTADILNGSGAGFAMPATMMPGTPEEGYQRIQLNLDFSNRGDVHVVDPSDFALIVAGRGLSFEPLAGGGFNNTVIGSSQLLSTVIAFDVPTTLNTADLRLVWRDGGNKITFALANGEGHDHG
jgi:hypothetical protein